MTKMNPVILPVDEEILNMPSLISKMARFRARKIWKEKRRKKSFKMTTVKVYKTDVDNRAKAQTIVNTIQQHLSDCIASFDLEDCDKVLRVEGKEVKPEKVRMLVQEFGFTCEVLE